MNSFKSVDRFVSLLAIACGYACLGLCFLIGYEVLARKFISHSVQGVDEIGGYVLAVTASVGFAYGLLHRVHTRIELVLVMLPAKMQGILNFIAALALAGFSVFMALRAYDALAESIDFGSRASTPLQTPLWLPQSIWFLGILLFAILSVLMAANAFYLLLRDTKKLNAAYGPPSLDEEIQVQMDEAERQMERDSMEKTND